MPLITLLFKSNASQLNYQKLITRAQNPVMKRENPLTGISRTREKCFHVLPVNKGHLKFIFQ